MPISQPPDGKNEMIMDKLDSVGVPVTTSPAIINSSNLKPLPY